MIAEPLLARVMNRQVQRILNFAVQRPGSAVAPDPDPERSYLLYVHVPFCEELCAYCSFNRVRLDPDLARRYFESLRRELELYRELGWRFDSLYVGGGTPTVLPEELGALLERARALWPIESVSVETNPDHLTPEILDRLQAAGVNRLSVGVQSFDDGILKAIGRFERYGSGETIARRLQSILGRFHTLNVDLIFNFPGQSREMFLEDLATVRRLAVDQVTFYPLMAARGVRRRIELLGRIDPRQEQRLYYLIQEQLGDLYGPSSAWCFAHRPADGRNGAPAGESQMIDEYIVGHEEYAGVGSGSFGYTGGTIYANTFALPEYIERVDRGELPIVASRKFSRGERLRYDFLMRLFGGTLDLEGLERRHGPGAARGLWIERLFLWLTGAVTRRGPKRQTLALTRRGYYFWVILMREFFTGVNNFREHCLTLRPERESLGNRP